MRIELSFATSKIIVQIYQKGNRIVVGDTSVYPSAILADPDKYFTEDVIQKLEEAANEEFSYGE